MRRFALIKSSRRRDTFIIHFPFQFSFLFVYKTYRKFLYTNEPKPPLSSSLT